MCLCKALIALCLCLRQKMIQLLPVGVDTINISVLLLIWNVFFVCCIIHIVHFTNTLEFVDWWYNCEFWKKKGHGLSCSHSVHKATWFTDHHLREFKSGKDITVLVFILAGVLTAIHTGKTTLTPQKLFWVNIYLKSLIMENINSVKMVILLGGAF